MKNILLLIHDDAGQEARLQVALDLVRAVEGHLSCMDVTYIPPIIGGGYYEDSYAIATLVTQEAEREIANKAKLEARLANEGLSWDWKEARGAFVPCLVRTATLADAIIVDRQLGDFSFPDTRWAVNELIVRSGNNVIAVPPDHPQFDTSSAMVAWDGSRSAGAALRAAVPLLRIAERVILVEAEDRSITVPAEDAARYLSRHGIHPEIRRLKSLPREAGATLLSEARGSDYGYCIMGGFSHLRLTEALFGGVTRSMLANSPIPVFLTH
ncbi:MAG: universal stress protein [Candidatus Sphingomonas colombiensis]|nr:universal stress protein [Sphingomonas sp.]WEK43208.1 MAG: universal stress protein [Sphingomonas sp.]